MDQDVIFLQTFFSKAQLRQFKKDKSKSKILGQYGTSSANVEYLKSYLNPDEYYSDYAKALGVDEGILRSVGELCSKPNLDREILKATQKQLDLSKII